MKKETIRIYFTDIELSPLAGRNHGYLLAFWMLLDDGCYSLFQVKGTVRKMKLRFPCPHDVPEWKFAAILEHVGNRLHAGKRLTPNRGYLEIERPNDADNRPE